MEPTSSWPIAVETSKHSIRSGSDSRLSVSRSCSSASTRRSRRCSPCARSLVRTCSAFSSASRWSRLLAALRRTDLDLAPRFSDRNSASAGIPASRGTTICGGTLGAHPSYSAEPSSTVVRSWPSTFSRWNECRFTTSRRATGRSARRHGRLPLRSRRCRPCPPTGAPRPAARRGAAPRRAGSGSAPRPRSAPPGRPRFIFCSSSRWIGRTSPEKELDDAVDDAAVVLLRHVADARRQAAVDVVVEARDAAVAARLRPLAGPVAEDAVEDVERLAHLLRVRVRAEVARRRGRCRSRVNITRGYSSSTVTAMYGNDLSSRSRTLNGGRWRLTRFCSRWSASTSLPVTITSTSATRAGRLRICARPSVALLEVRADARPQRLRLADVEDVAVRVPEQVDARLRRERLQLVLRRGRPRRPP